MARRMLACRNGPTGLPATTDIGLAVTIGAGSLLRSCKIEDMAVIGERSIVMEGSVISSKAVLLPGTVVPPAKIIPKKQVWGGNPAAFVRNLTHDEVRIPPCCGLRVAWAARYLCTCTALVTAEQQSTPEGAVRDDTLPPYLSPTYLCALVATSPEMIALRARCEW